MLLGMPRSCVCLTLERQNNRQAHALYEGRVSRSNPVRVRFRFFIGKVGFSVLHVS